MGANTIKAAPTRVKTSQDDADDGIFEQHIMAVIIISNCLD